LENHYYEKFDIDINDFSGHLFAKQFNHKAFIAHDLHDEIVKRTTKKAQTILNKREQEEKKKQRQIQSLKKIMNELGDGVYEAFAKINDSTPKI